MLGWVLFGGEAVKGTAHGKTVSLTNRSRAILLQYRRFPIASNARVSGPMKCPVRGADSGGQRDSRSVIFSLGL
jgi:hypothetical protein